MADQVKDSSVDLVVGMESRGFIFSAPLAYQLHAGFVPVRKLGKLPAETIEVEYDLEYGTATLEIHKDAIQPGQRVLIVDDLLATGGTVQGTTALAEHHEGLVPQPLFLMGDPDGCEALLETVIKPRDAYFQASDEHHPAMAAHYDLEPPSRMLRMTVNEETFRPFAGSAERLTAADIEDLNHLYQLGFRTGFPISVVEDGLYYGVRVHGRLVSAAGTHVVNLREGGAVVGNVMT